MPHPFGFPLPLLASVSSSFFEKLGELLVRRRRKALSFDTVGSGAIFWQQSLHAHCAKTLCVILTEDLEDPMAQRVAIRVSLRS